jgi:CubicO group peptidase (beta-lactamase class C family)
MDFRAALMKYGYLWWTIEYPYKGRTVRAYFASGNGGQEVLVVPELDMVIGCYGGNYADRGGDPRIYSEVHPGRG